MIRKLSAKALILDDRNRKHDSRAADNEYYLPHPTVKLAKVTLKEPDGQDREKMPPKCARKASYNPAHSTASLALLKADAQNLSKQLQGSGNKNYVTKKVESRKMRSTSNGETPKRSLSKSAFKLQLTGRKRDGLTKRINLQIEAPTTKKPVDKLNLHEINYDSYYNNNHNLTESKSIRTLKKPEAGQSLAGCDLQLLYGRCRLVIEEYEEQLEAARRENAQLLEQNRRLRLERSPKGRTKE